MFNSQNYQTKNTNTFKVWIKMFSFIFNIIIYHAVIKTTKNFANVRSLIWVDINHSLKKNYPTAFVRVSQRFQPLDNLQKTFSAEMTEKPQGIIYFKTIFNQN